MRNSVFCMIITALLCLELRAQDGSVSLAYQRVENRYVVQLTNQHKAPLEAYVVLIRFRSPAKAKGTFLQFDDAFLNWPGSTVLEPNQSRSFEIGANDGSADIQFVAAIFADGTVSGDPLWIDRLIQSRKQIQRDLAKALVQLQSALDNRTDVETVRQWFEDLRQQNQQQASSVGEDALQHIPLSVIGNLETIAKPELFQSTVRALMGHFQTWQLRLAQSKPRLSN